MGEGISVGMVVGEIFKATFEDVFFSLERKNHPEEAKSTTSAANPPTKTQLPLFRLVS